MIAPNRALAFAIVLGVGSFLILYFLVNPLAAALSLGGNAYYVFVYTMWLKRRTSQNIVIGGAAGSIPPLVGWAAVTGSVGLPGARARVLIFLWTPPHFWALALMTETDYDKAGIPMLPNVHGVARTKREMLAIRSSSSCSASPSCRCTSWDRSSSPPRWSSAAGFSSMPSACCATTRDT